MYVACDDWTALIHAFRLGGGKCGPEAQVAIRLTFHDAIGLSMALKSSGKPGRASIYISIIIVEITHP
jgi:hypothetical protein